MLKTAKKIWLKGLSKEVNIQARFVTELPAAKDTTLYVTGATFYKVYFDGNLIHYGPSPTATGYARVDTVKLPAFHSTSDLVIEVAGYNSNSYAAVNQESYIAAEIWQDGELVRATGKDFKAYRVNSRKQKVVRYSGQRHFSEIWNLDLHDEPCDIEEITANITYLARRAPLPSITKNALNTAYCKSKFTYIDTFDENYIDETSLSVNRTEFSFDEIIPLPMARIAQTCYEIKKDSTEAASALSEGEFIAFECKNNSSGLFGLDFIASEGARFIIAFDERLEDGKFPFKLITSNVIEVSASGHNCFENFEIYAFKYFAIFVISGSVEIKGVQKIDVKNSPAALPTLNTDDEELLTIYESALESLRCNTLGILTDCPSRERAGWLGDSSYIARAAYALTKDASVEADFLENYLNHSCKTIPDGMVPMCYPAEHPKGTFIPQYAMWFILQLSEFAQRMPNTYIGDVKTAIYAILSYFEGFENELGLLEDLPSWNFVEWSMANKWCKGVNFPTNMLYARVLELTHEMYRDEKLLEKCEAIRRTVREMSYDGRFFHDQAMREPDGALTLNGNISETCQYYAFYFGTASEEDYPELVDRLISEFGPSVDNYPSIEKSNAWMGILLRMDLLLKWGKEDLLISQIKEYFLGMARMTGTLWEHKTVAATLNHGFPSYVAKLLLDVFNK